MAKSKLPTSSFFLKLATAAFFLVLGLCGIFPNVEESIFSLNNTNHVIEVIFGILELICALVIFAGLFTKLRRNWMSLASLVIFIFWVLRVFYTQFFNKFHITGSSITFLPDTMQWILNFTLELVVLAAIWTINRTYND
ncbi:MAG: hypothetical protein JW969_15880 [Spirochaetales bacterium]|nr:hypothetical protein [Spirochaetales bacterium]